MPSYPEIIAAAVFCRDFVLFTVTSFEFIKVCSKSMVRWRRQMLSLRSMKAPTRWAIRERLK